MADLLRRVFWAVPALRDAAATWRGRQIDAERYGAAYHATQPDIAARQEWPAERMRAYCGAQLRALVETAAAHVPHYREAFRAHGVAPADIRGVDDLARLPLLEKAALREAPLRLLDERVVPAGLVWGNTSGTTGTPLRIGCTRDCNQTHYAFFEVRHRRLAGMHFGSLPYAMLGGQIVAPVRRTRPPFWCYNRTHRQLYLSSYHLSDANFPAYVAELRRRPYHALMGYPSSVHAIARYILDSGTAPLRIPIVSTSSETLFEHQRSDIETAFGARVFDQYGCAELCVFASQADDGVMYVSPDYGLVEVLDAAGAPAAPGEVGEIVCTGLLNHAQPLIRYRIGDRGALAPPAARFPALPLLARLEGRVDKVLRMRDGRRIGRLDPVFKGVAGVRECQIVQEDWELFRLRIVAGAGYRESVGALLAANLRERVGDVQVRITLEESIERTANGKFEAVVSRVRE